MWHDTTKIPTYMTIGIKNALEQGDEKFANHITNSINKYFQQDWGDTHKDDWSLNDSAVENADDRVLAVYEHPDYDKIFIITEYDRSATTILFADEY